MNPDDKLKQVLGQWRDIEPRAQFEADVMRRLREPATEPAAWATRFGLQPAWVHAVAMLAGIAVGVYAGLGSNLQSPNTTLLKPGTLAGNYVSMISGGAR